MIELESVCKSYQRVKAVDALSFSVKEGEIFALLGPNGAGKTTCIRMIMQIIQPDEGLIRFDDRMVYNGKVRRSRLGYLPEERGLYPDTPVLDTLLYLGGLRHSDQKGLKQNALEWLKRFGLLDRRKDKISTLSKGNQQKVQFIASVLHRPDFAVLDEPFSGFDPINQEMISDVIRELRNNGTTILLSAHQMQLVERIADRILLLDSGRERVCGTLQEIRAKTISNRKISVRFEEEVSIDKMKNLKGVRDSSNQEGNSWDVYPEEQFELNQILKQLSELAPITDVNTSESGLHEIFLHSFNNKSN
ncbi:ATP-binding cassette domain-containing protein [Balneolaceae bacterium ANBcel3]|nr:ATP-binding cassette domain-containing protein [Balneolaceae bacterium ANBcel3]